MPKTYDYQKAFSGTYIDNRSKRLFDIKPDDILQLIPVKYQWVIDDCFMKGCANNWMPSEVPMTTDYTHWQELSPQEQWCLAFNFGFFSSAEGLIANNLVQTLYNIIPSPEMRLYFLRQMYEEGIHALTFAYISESLPIDQQLIFNMHRNVPIIEEKDAFSKNLVSVESVRKADLKTVDGKHTLLLNLIGFYLIMEGIFFYGGFPQMLSFGKRNKMVGMFKQILFILRDESIHILFGTRLIKTIIEEYPEVWSPEFHEEIISIVKHAVDLEQRCVDYSVGQGKDLLGLNSADVKKNVEYIADKRLNMIGLDKYFNSPCTLEWLNELTDLSRETNFFEGTVQNYRMDGLKFST